MDVFRRDVVISLDENLLFAMVQMHMKIRTDSKNVFYNIC